METIGEILVAVVTFVFEVILLALKLLVALFVTNQRSSLKEKWNSSMLKRVEIIFSLIFIISVFGAILYFIFMINGCSRKNLSDESNSSVHLSEQPDSEDRSIKIEISDDMKEKAVDFLKEKWKERKNE